MKKSVMVLAIMVLGLFGACWSGACLQTALAATNVCDDTSIDKDLREAAGCDLDEEDTAVPVVFNLIEVVLGLVGVLTAGMVVYGGIMYVISTGDAMKIRRAQNTVLYGVIGMVIASLAYAIVYFVSKGVWGGQG